MIGRNSITNDSAYRHAEIIARDRLQLLQDAVDKTVGAVKRKGDP